MLRREIMEANVWSLRDLYRTLDPPGANRPRDARTPPHPGPLPDPLPMPSPLTPLLSDGRGTEDGEGDFDTAVRDAYGMKPDEDILAFLLNLDFGCAGNLTNR